MHPSLILQFEIKANDEVEASDAERKVYEATTSVISEGGYRKPFKHGIAFQEERLTHRLDGFFRPSIFAVTELFTSEEQAESLSLTLRERLDANGFRLMKMTTRESTAESEASHVLLYFGGDPESGPAPKKMQEHIFEMAEASGIAMTTSTQFHSYRNCQDMVDRGKSGESNALVGVTELAVKLGEGMPMVDRYLQKNIVATEFYVKRRVSGFRLIPEYCVVILH